MRPAGEPDCSKLADLLAGLDSNAFTERSRASEMLRKMLEDAEKAFVVEKALRRLVSTSPSLEARTRADRLLTNFREPAPNTGLLRELRAVSLLTKIATPESQRVLQSLAGGSEDARLTQEAKASLERLARH
jgi:hypothetical protein